MDVVLHFDLDLNPLRPASQSIIELEFTPHTHHLHVRSATSPPAFHAFRLRTPAVQEPALRKATSTRHVSACSARGREDRVDHSLDDQSASAVDLDAVSVRSIPGEFKDDIFHGHEAPKAERVEKGIFSGQAEAQGEPGQMADSRNRTQSSHASASGSVGKATLSTKQIGKFPAHQFRQQPYENSSGSDTSKWEAETLKKTQAEMQQPRGDRCSLTKEKTDKEMIRSEVDSSTGNQPQILHPRPRNRRPLVAVRMWEHLASIINQLPPPGFAALSAISHYGLGLGAKTAQPEADDDIEAGGSVEEISERRVLRPVPVIEQEITFPRLYDPADMRTVLISTRGFEESNMLASHVRLSGLKAVAEKWTLLSLTDEETSKDGSANDKGDFALVRLVPRKKAMEIITLIHGEKWISCGMGIPRRLCVLFIEPRRGGEVLIEGLTMPEGDSGKLMRKLTLFLLLYDLAALSDPKPMKDENKYWCTAEFALSGRGERAVAALSSVAFYGTKLQLTLLRGSLEPPSLWPAFPSPRTINIVKARAQDKKSSVGSGKNGKRAEAAPKPGK